MQKEFKRTKALVKDILTKEPKTRNSDQLLYIKVVERLNSQANGKPFEEVMANLEELGLPCFETVRRSRQQLQATHENLKACDIVQDFRSAREEAFKKEFGGMGTC